jgi:hypothetical protein
MARKMTNEENENLNMVGTGILRKKKKNEKNDKCIV